VTMTSGLVSLTATITDNDGDHASSSLDISQKLVFRDDAPTMATGTATVPTLTVDESFLTSATNGINGTTPDVTLTNTHASASFANDFVSNPGADGQSGSIAYALSINGGDGTDSGLVDAQSGQHVLLSLNGSTVEGRTATGHDLVFTVQVDGSGNVT